MKTFFDTSEEKDMTFKVSKLKDVFKDPAVAAVPELAGLPQKTIKYLVYCYDANSPFVKRSRNLTERRENAARKAGILQKDWPGVMSLSDELVDAIMAMLKYQMSNEWSLIVINEQAFEEIKRRVLVPVEDDKDKDEISALERKEKLLQIADHIFQRLKQYKSSFYLGDQDLEDKAERVRFSPESIAKHV